MAGAIKGITVEIGGDTTKLGKALGDVNAKSKTLQAELKGVKTLLKLDPTNVTLLKQKQDLLTTAISNTKTKLDTLKEAMRQIDSGATQATEEEYRDLQREIASTEQKLKSLTEEQRKFGSVGAQQIAAYGEKLQGIGSKVEAVGQKFSKLSMITGAVLAGSTKLASDFENGVAKVGTIADTSHVSLDQLSKDMLQLSTDTGKSATEISEATYQAISASVDTADAVGFVKTATDLAKAGFLDTTSAVDVLTTTINAYGLQASDAEGISNKLLETQNKGKTTVDQLAQSMGTVIPTAAAYGVNIDQLCTAYAELTKQGINTENATTYLSGMFTELADTGSTVAGVLQEKTGKSFSELMDGGASLGDVMGILKDATGGNSTEFANLWGNVRAGRGALALANTGADEFNNTLNGMQTSTGNVAKALEVLDTPGARATKALNAVKNSAITLGQTLLDAIAPVLKKVSTALQNLATWFSNLSPSIQQAIVVILAIVTAIGPLLIIVGKLIGAVGTIMTVAPAIVGALGAISAPVMIVVGAVAALVAAFVHLWNTNEDFRNKITEIWSGIVSKFQDFFQGITDRLNDLGFNFEDFGDVIKGIWDKICNFLAPQFEAVFEIISSVLGAALDILTGLFDVFAGIFTGNWDMVWTGIKEIFSGIWDGIKGVFSGILDGLLGIVDAFLSLFGTNWSTCWTNIKTFCENIWNGIKDFFTVTIPGIISSIVTWFSELPGKIWSAITGAISKVSEWCSNVKSTMSTGVQSLISNAINFFSQLPGKIWSAIVGAVSKVSQWCSNVRSTMANGVQNLISNVINFFKQLPGKIWSAIVGAVSKVSQWGSSMLSTAKSAVSKVVSGIVDTFKELPGKMVSIGSNVIKGITSGITGAVGGLYSTIKNALSGLVDKAKRALGIHSPSKVMADAVGKYIPSGIGQGITDNEQDAIDPMEVLTGDLTEAGNNALTLDRKLTATFTDPNAGGLTLDEIRDTIIDTGKKIADACGKDVLLDGDTLIGHTVDRIDTALGQKYKLKMRGV